MTGELSIDLTIEFIGIVVALVASKFLEIWGRLMTYKNPHDSYIVPVLWSVSLFLGLLNLWFSTATQIYAEGMTFSFNDLLVLLVQPCLIFFALMFLFPFSTRIEVAPGERVEFFRNHFDRYRPFFFGTVILMLIYSTGRDYWEYIRQPPTDVPPLGFWEVIVKDELKLEFRILGVIVAVLAACLGKFWHQIALSSAGIVTMVAFLYFYGN